MRTLIGLGLLAAMALPGIARADTPCDRAQDLLTNVRAERIRLEGDPTAVARKAVRYLVKGEKTLGKLVQRLASEPAIESKNLALFAKAGQWIDRAQSTGAVASDAPPVIGWNEWFEGCMSDIDAFVDDAVVARDRILSEKFRNKVQRRLAKGLAFYDAAGNETDAVTRARLMVSAVQQVGAAAEQARKLCAKESKPNCPSGIYAENQLLAYRGRGMLTVFDLEWSITVRTSAGVLVSQRDGNLNAPGRVLAQPLPYRLQRGQTLDGLQAAEIPAGFGHRMDGLLTWHTSAGVIEVPLHLGQ